MKIKYHIQVDGKKEFEKLKNMNIELIQGNCLSQMWFLNFKIMWSCYHIK